MLKKALIWIIAIALTLIVFNLFLK